MGNSSTKEHQRPAPLAPGETRQSRYYSKHGKGIVASNRGKRKAETEELKRRAGGRCVRCGYGKCLRALDFHHIDSSTKVFCVGQRLGKTWDDVIREANKCELLCANCHREQQDMEDEKRAKALRPKQIRKRV